LGRSRPIRHGDETIADRLFNEWSEKVLFILVVKVYRAFWDVGQLRDIFHAYGRKTFVGEFRQRGLQ
jgi:hypothetical protein